MNYRIVIPARYHSARLPGKVLLTIQGKSILQHVYEKAQQTTADDIIIAVDHPAVAKIANALGAQVCMTSTTHETGTDRIAEVVEQLNVDDEDIIVNVQGDEVLIAPENIDCVAELCRQHPDVAVASLYSEMKQTDDIFDPHIVKVVFDQTGRALYFSRAPIVWERDNFRENIKEHTMNNTQSVVHSAYPHYQHIGLYAYRVSALREYVQWAPSPMETAEKLEQLRFLWYGKQINLAPAPKPVLPGVDVQADVDRINAYLLATQKD